jgi:RNA polymerase sigma-70 factor (ECF subfamily)
MAAYDPAADGEERRLLTRVGAGDRAAFETLYAAYARRVAAFVRDIVVSNELTDEVVSDTMIAVWHAAARFRGQSRVATWVLGIAHHKALDALRRAGRPHVPLDSVPESDFQGAGGPVDELLRLEDRFAFDLALRALSTGHRTVLQLMYGFGCTHAEIAAIVGCPVATVKTRAFYAKRHLRAELDRAHTAEELA